MPKETISNLVFQGGSVRGVAYLGAAQGLEAAGIPLQQIKRVAGTSAGSIAALLIALGYDVEAMRYEMDALDFKEILDEPGRYVATKGALLDTAAAKGATAGRLFSRASKHSVPVSSAASRLSSEYGLYDGEFFRRWAENVIHTITAEEHLTFADLHTRVVNEPAKYKDLFVVGVNLSTSESEVFNYIKTPDVIVADAIRISMSIPFVFKPHALYRKQGGKRVPDSKGHQYVDGGLLDNYPVWAFDYKGFVEPGLPESDGHFWDPVRNDQTLGFRLVSAKQRDYLQGAAAAPEQEMRGFYSFTKAIFQAMRAKENSDHQHRGDQDRTVYIDTVDVDTLDFDLTTKDKDRLVESGRHAVDDYAQKHWPAPIVPVQKM